MQIRNDSGSVFMLYSNLVELIQEMEEKRKLVATLVDNITETTFLDAQSKQFKEHFEGDMTLLKKLHDDMEEKQETLQALGNALKKYEEDIVF